MAMKGIVPPSPIAAALGTAGITRKRNSFKMALDAGFRHVVLGLSAPYPADVARWVADEIVISSVRS